MALGREGHWMSSADWGKYQASLCARTEQGTTADGESAVPQNTYYMLGIVPGPREAKE